MLLYSQPTSAEEPAPTPFSIAFFYAANPPFKKLKTFDIVVVDPDNAGTSPKEHQTENNNLFAYVSVGEADPCRPFFKRVDPVWLIADNSNWGTKVVDLANPAWRNFFLEQIVEPLWAAGYRGFFLDTLDSYQLVKDKGRIPQLTEGLIEVIREIKRRHPEAKLILNRGFDVLKQIKDVTFAVAAESLFQNFNPATGTYGIVKEQDRIWLLDHLNAVRKSGLPVIAIDYVDPSERGLARSTANKIKELGFIPWVTDKGLSSLGDGAIAVQPGDNRGIYFKNQSGQVGLDRITDRMWHVAEGFVNKIEVSHKLGMEVGFVAFILIAIHECLLYGIAGIVTVFKRKEDICSTETD